MPFEPDDLPSSTPSLLNDTTSQQHETWIPIVSHGCTFNPDIFSSTMMNLIRNPNLNSSWLFRADILFDDAHNHHHHHDHVVEPLSRHIHGMTIQRTLVRKLIPRSDKRDSPLNQTCSFHSAQESDGPSSSSAATTTTTCVLYLPHGRLHELPFYHPKVLGIAHLHRWHAPSSTGTISVHFLVSGLEQARDPKLRRVAFHLLEVLHKHGEGSSRGYTKRVHHDVVIPQARFQDRYSTLKAKHARHLVRTWAESTDPTKHVFEDLGIAAFLIELWSDMYPHAGPSPTFVDIGCGNGLLVHILTQEGHRGWGFDARARKSWASYATSSPSATLEEKLLLPAIASTQLPAANTHDGLFPPGTFIISNHADELTPWTPILAALSQCPFIMIPCCSHDLTGAKFRAPPPRDRSKPASTYASLVDWLIRIAHDCGWATETEMLRIPSTRNTCILGRRRRPDAPSTAADLSAVIGKYGGAEGFCDNVAKLMRMGPRTH